MRPRRIIRMTTSVGLKLRHCPQPRAMATAAPLVGGWGKSGEGQEWRGARVERGKSGGVKSGGAESRGGAEWRSGERRSGE